MAAKKKKKAKKAGAAKKKAVKTRKAKKTSPAKKKTVAKKSKKAPAKKKKTAKTAKKKAPARKTAKKAKKKRAVGEGDYAATRAFDRDQASFVKKNKANIPAMGEAAEAALDGPQGDMLRDAEAAAAGRSRDTF